MMSMSSISTPCGGGGGAPAVAYVMVLTKPKFVSISTAGSVVDTVLDLRRQPCLDSASAIECHDNFSTTDKSSRINRSLPPGVYYVVVQAKTASLSGRYTLRVQQFAGEGEACIVQGDCGPGLVCRAPGGTTQKICTRPECSDGTDDDADGKLDYPNDPGCSSEIDNSELDDCPAGPSCPKCSDGVDNDGDGAIDYPLDESCKAAGDGSEACITSEKPIEIITTATTMGTTVGAVNDYDPTCNLSTGVAPDRLYRIDLPAMATLSLNVSGFDTVHALHDSTCGGTAIACSDPPLMTVTGLAAGTYYLVVDARSSTSGAFTITMSGEIAAGESCEGSLYQTGVFGCEGGLICDGPVGLRTCRSQCADGADNNGDGKIDYPDDPGCEAPGDNFEDTVCPGPTCPVCSDGVDNDGDNLTDYPNDPACEAAGGPSEVCSGEDDPILPITAPTTVDTLAGASDDHDPSCGSDGGRDRMFTLDVPALATLRIDTEGSSSNTLLSLLSSTCGEPSIECNDGVSINGALIQRTDVPAGRYIVAVDVFNATSTASAFNLNVSGTVAPDESCEGALFQSGALTCASGYTCEGPAGARTCRASQCNDGMDNNGDGRIDYPSDPGCSNPSDPAEDTVCPGPTCPVCSDGADNDADMMTDYPTDTSCSVASGATEACNAELNPILPIRTRSISDTMVGATDEFNPSCGQDGGADRLFTLELPALATLKIDTEGSSFDTLLSLLNSTCALPSITCNDDSGILAGASLIKRTNVAAGLYIVSVDAYNAATVPGPFNLNVSGTVTPGGACEGPLFENGVLTCAVGYFCAGPAGARTCRSQCNDGVDNNGDGRADYPADPGCTDILDTVEDTVCPGASCPVCSNMDDDDGDMQIDWPADLGCQAASGTTEAFCPSDPDLRGAITMPVTAGTLAAPAADHVEPACLISPANSGNEVVYALVAPVAASWVISTDGSAIVDTILSLYDSNCSLPPLACDDDGGAGALSQISMDLPAGNYAIQVDSFSQTGNNGPFLLNVQGTAEPGADCTSPLFTTGVLVCSDGQTCGPAGVCE
jgi:hypothetical protein